MMAIGCVENIVQAPIIVYGCGRSGTSILQKAIGAHKEVINAGKEDPLLSHLAVFYQAYCGRDREYRSANYRGGLKGLGTSLAQMVFENEFGVGFHVEEEIKRWVTKSFPHMSNIHGLKDMFPQMDIVFIYRNAADVCE